MSKYINIPNEMHERIKYLRIENGYTQREVAEAINIGIAAYSHYENGKRSINTDIITRLADFYSVTSDFIMGYTSFANARNSSNILSFFSDAALENIINMESMKSKDAISMLNSLLSDEECIPLLEGLKKVCEIPDIISDRPQYFPKDEEMTVGKKYLLTMLGLDEYDSNYSLYTLEKLIGTLGYDSKNYFRVARELLKSAFMSHLENFIAKRARSKEVHEAFREKLNILYRDKH